MKKLLLTLASAALATVASAQVSVEQRPNFGVVETSPVITQYQQTKKVAKIAENQRWLGYYNSDALAESGMGVPSIPGDNKAAILLSSDMLKPYEGKKIVGVRFGLCAEIGESRAFMAEIKDNAIGEDAVSKEVPTTQVGWNEVIFDTPYTISANSVSGLLVGFDYYQIGESKNKDAYPLSAVEEGDPQYMYLYCNYTQSQGLGWYAFSMSGRNISIQVLLEGSFPAYNVIPEDFGMVAGTLNSEAEIPVSFFNLSKEPVSSIDYVVTVDGVAGEEQHLTFNPEVGVGSYGTFNVKVATGSADGRKNIQVEVKKVNGHDNEADNKVSKGSLGYASTQYPRNVVIEEFTTELCPNCPRVAGYLHEYFETADHDHVYGVCHHSAYYTDWLTQPCDEDLTYLFNDAGSTFAPAVMFNREPDFESYYNKGAKDNVTIPGSADEIGQIVDYYRTETMANAQLAIQVFPNADKTQVTLGISGEANMAYATDKALLTVYMTEDNVKAKSQSGGGSNYTHQHVIRAYNSSWGDQVYWQDNKFYTTYTFDIDKAWKQDDLKFVAFLNKHNAKNVLDNRIENSIGISLEDGVAAVNGVNVEGNATEVARYNAAGQRVYGKQKGLNIVKLSDGRTLKVMEK